MLAEILIILGFIVPIVGAFLTFAYEDGRWFLLIVLGFIIGCSGYIVADNEQAKALNKCLLENTCDECYDLFSPEYDHESTYKKLASNPMCNIFDQGSVRNRWIDNERIQHS